MRLRYPQPSELFISKTFFYKKLVFVQDSNTFLTPKDNIDNYFNYQSVDVYKGFSQSELLLYFKELGVDTPQSLNKVVSYHRTAFKTRAARFNNYLQRSGKKMKFFILLLKAYNAILSTQEVPLVRGTSSLIKWREIYFLSNSLLQCSGRTQAFTLPSTYPTSFSLHLKKFNLVSEANTTLDKFLFGNLLKTDLLFSFYIYKVDKHLFKNSRGKSGKFTFI